MAYELHIARNPEISLTEWSALVASIPGLRLDSTPTTARNPTTGEVIKVGGQQGFAAMEIDGQWVKVFRWNQGKISFVMRGSATDRTLTIAHSLAQKLNAEVRGDDGELYKAAL